MNNICEADLSYSDSGVGTHVVVLLHGFGCDRTSLDLQASFLAELGYRILSVDLRGHGESPSPEGDYTMQVFARDVERMLGKLGISRALVIGHSMGGVVGLFLASTTNLVSGLVMIDSTVCSPDALIESLKPIRGMMREEAYQENYVQLMRGLAGSHNCVDVCRKTHDFGPKARQHVLISALDAHFDQKSIAEAAHHCRVPTAYISSMSPLADLLTLKEHIPQIVTAQTLGAGHFCHLCVPEQINPMLLDFIEAATRNCEEEHTTR